MSSIVSIKYFFLVYVLLAAGGIFFTIFVVASFPPHAGWWTHAALYSTLGMSVFGIAGVGGLITRRITGSRIAVARSAGTVARQSLLLAFTVLAAVIFQAFRLLTIYTAIALIVTAAIFELYFLTR